VDRHHACMRRPAVLQKPPWHPDTDDTLHSRSLPPLSFRLYLRPQRGAVVFAFSPVQLVLHPPPTRPRKRSTNRPLRHVDHRSYEDDSRRSGRARSARVAPEGPRYVFNLQPRGLTSDSRSCLRTRSRGVATGGGVCRDLGGHRADLAAGSPAPPDEPLQGSDRAARRFADLRRYHRYEVDPFGLDDMAIECARIPITPVHRAADVQWHRPLSLLFR